MQNDTVGQALLHQLAHIGGCAALVHVLEQHRIALLLQRAGDAGENGEHMRVFKGDALIQLGGKDHGAALLPGEAARAGVGLVLEPARGFQHMPSGFLGNGVAAAERLGDSGDGNARLPRQIINGDRHGEPPYFAVRTTRYPPAASRPDSTPLWASAAAPAAFSHGRASTGALARLNSTKTRSDASSRV